MGFNPKKLNELEALVLQIRDSIPAWIKAAVENNKEVIIDLQTQVQMYQGNTSEDSEILPPYAESTKKRKLANQQPIDRVTLKDTGKFYESIEVDVRNDEFEIKSPIQYSIYLVRKYGAIFGLTPKNLEKFVLDYIVPEIKKNIDELIAES